MDTQVRRNRQWLVPALTALALAVLPGVALAGSGGAAPGSINANLLHLGDRVLNRGMDGRDVRELQSDLTQVGFTTRVTGHFGWATRKNVLAYQTSKHLNPTGMVSIGLARRLRKAVAAIARHRVTKARIRHGVAIAPSNAPASVKSVIAAANRIAFKPYVYGGGHGSWNDSGYDCSGSVSYALHGGHLISAPEDSTELESYGRAGRGRWITIEANSGHTYMYVAGLRFDTSAQSSTGGSRWTAASRDNGGFVTRHPRGL